MSEGASTSLTGGPGRLIVLSGPSGVGKDTVLRELFGLDPQLRYSVSFTTRPPRSGERDGVSYSFVDDATFDAMIARDEFLEHATVYDHRYGTSLRRVEDAVARGDEIVLKIDVQGAESVRRRLGGRPLFIFLLPPNEAELRRRLQERATEDHRGLELREATSIAELAECEKYDHRVVNDDVGRAAREILGIIQSERRLSHG